MAITVLLSFLQRTQNQGRPRHTQFDMPSLSARLNLLKLPGSNNADRICNVVIMKDKSGRANLLSHTARISIREAVTWSVAWLQERQVKALCEACFYQHR